MMTFIIQSTIIWGSLYLFYVVWLKKETFYKFNRIFLLATLLTGLIIPLIEIQGPSGIEYERFFSNLDPIVITAAEGTLIKDDSIITNILSFPYWRILATIYAIGVLYQLIKLGHGLSVILKMYNKGEKKFAENHTEVYCDDFEMPFSFYKWIFFPKSLKSSSAFESIRSHELKHIEQQHSLDLILFEFIRIIFWFNPFLILLKRAIEENHEFVADQAGLKVLEKKDYGEMLIDMNFSPLYLNFTNNFNNSIIKNRLIMMYKTKSKKQNHLKYILALPLVALFLLMFSCQQEKNVNKEDEVSTEKEVVKEDTQNSSDEVFKVVEQMPRFPGCEDLETKEEIEKCSSQKMMEYIFSTLKYPEAARKKEVEGKVIASFVIDKAGMIKDISILRDIGEGCGDEVVKVLNSMNDMEERWTPGVQNGVKVKVEYTLPVVFKLQ